MKKPIYVLTADRTQAGRYGGALRHFSAPRLGAIIVRATLGKLRGMGIEAGTVDGLIAGNVYSSLMGYNPGRQAAIYGGLPESCPAATVNKACSSSMYALELAAEKIRAGNADIMMALGMESMDNVPFLLPRIHCGAPAHFNIKDKNADFGDNAYDALLYDGLTDVFDPSMPHMGELADRGALKHGLSRREQDQYTYKSMRRAWKNKDKVSRYLTPVSGAGPKEDEGLQKPDLRRIVAADPYFTSWGTVTKASSSKMGSAASGVTIVSENFVVSRNIQKHVLAEIIDFSTHSHEPAWYTTAPAFAIEKLLKKTGLTVNDIDLFEINEAQAVVPLYAMKVLGIPISKVNVNGGGIGGSHPIGASGLKIFVDLLYELLLRKGRYGIAAICNAGGEAMACFVRIPRRT